jgi:hypothetical protein
VKGRYQYEKGVQAKVSSRVLFFIITIVHMRRVSLQKITELPFFNVFLLLKYNKIVGSVMSRTHMNCAPL